MFSCPSIPSTKTPHQGTRRGALLLCMTLIFWSWLVERPVSAECNAGTPYTLKIGAVLPLSGALAHVGNDIKEGMTLALEEHESKTLNFEFVWEDGKFDLRDSVTAAKKLIAIDEVDAIISLWDTADVIAPITEKHKVIQLSIRWNPDVAARNRFTFTFESTFHTYFQDVAKLLQMEKIKKVAFLIEDTQAGNEQLLSFRTACQRHGIEVVGDASFPTGTTDFRSILTRLLSRKPEMVVNDVFLPALPALLRSLRALNPHMRHTGFYEVLPDSPLIEGAPFVSQLGLLPEFSKKFEQRFGRPFIIRAPHGYESVRILEWAYRGATEATCPPVKPTTERVAATLEQLRNFPSILGPLSASKTRNIEHPNTLKVMRNGKLIPYSG